MVLESENVCGVWPSGLIAAVSWPFRAEEFLCYKYASLLSSALPLIQTSALLPLLPIFFSWLPSGALAVAVFVVAGVVVLHAPVVVVAMVCRQCLPLFLWSRASGDMIFSCAFVVKTPLAFFFLLIFLPLLLNMV